MGKKSKTKNKPPKNTDLPACMICCKKTTKRVNCNKCSQFYCGNCYIKIFTTNKGIITCPYCRFSFGEIVPDYMISICIDEIKMKLGV